MSTQDTTEDHLCELREVVALFVDQGRDGAMIIPCIDVVVPLIGHALDNFDADSRGDLCLTFVHPFEDPPHYLAACRDELRENGLEEGASSSLRELLHAVADRLPPGDLRLVVALLPPTIHNITEYHALASELLNPPLPRLRLLLREPCDISPTLEDPGVLHRHPLPITLDSLANSARILGEDPSRPPEQRIPYLLQHGFHRLGGGDLEGAEADLSSILRLVDPEATPREEPQIFLALACFGLGEVLARRGDHPRAVERLLVGWRAAGDQAPPRVKEPLAAALGREFRALGMPEEARVFLALAAACATLGGSPEIAGQRYLELGDLVAELDGVEAAREAFVCGQTIVGNDADSAISRQLRTRIQDLHPPGS